MIRITNEIIQIGTKSYPTKNISSFEKIDKREGHRIPIPEEQRKKLKWEMRRKRFLERLIFWGVIGCALILGWWYAILKNSIGLKFLALIPTVYWALSAPTVVLALLEDDWDRDRHSDLHIVASYIVRMNLTGDVVDIRTDSEWFRNRIYDAVEKAITHSARVNYTVNVEKQEIVNNNQTHIDQSTTNNYDYSINFNRYEGLSEDQLRFLSTEFNGALSRLAQDLRHEGDDELRQQLDELVATLKASSENPEDAGRLKKSWARFKGLCEVYDLSQSALGLVGTIGKGVGIVTGLVT